MEAYSSLHLPLIHFLPLPPTQSPSLLSLPLRLSFRGHAHSLALRDEVNTASHCATADTTHLYLLHLHLLPLLGYSSPQVGTLKKHRPRYVFLGCHTHFDNKLSQQGCKANRAVIYSIQINIFSCFLGVMTAVQEMNSAGWIQFLYICILSCVRKLIESLA